MFVPNKHDKLIRMQKTPNTPEFHFKNIKLANFTGLSFISLPLLKQLKDAFAPVHD